MITPDVLEELGVNVSHLALAFYGGVPWEELTLAEQEAFSAYMVRWRASRPENVEEPT